MKPDPQERPKDLITPINPRALGAGLAVVRPLFRSYFRVEVSGREHLPPLGEAGVMAVNHSSNLDAFLCGYALDRPSYFLVKAEALKTPLVGRWLGAVGGIPANRDQQDTKALRQMMRLLKAGHFLSLAPEGTRSKDGALLPYDPGFVWLALRTGTQMVPAAIHGAHEVLPSGAKVPRPGRLWFRFGAPIDLSAEARPSKERLAELAAEVRQRTLELLAELAEESGLPSQAVEMERRANNRPTSQ
jgi:1-acyl-sn-glycerol-3-phosphate acyltransferase